MPRVRKIYGDEKMHRHYYLADANFLVTKHIPLLAAPAGLDRQRLGACHDWWREIDRQLAGDLARVYVPDICIAEAFKTLAKKYYVDKWFKSHAIYQKAKDKLSEDIRTSGKDLKAFARKVRFHDISTNRDIIISVDRFYEVFLKNKKHVQIADLILVATAKYLMDFYDIPKDWLHIVTLDHALREGISKVPDLPNAYDPTRKSHRAELVFG